jgi:hypothetical protein
MHNRSLAEDYLTRATHRLAALDVLFERESWADAGDCWNAIVRDLPAVLSVEVQTLP